MKPSAAQRAAEILGDRNYWISTMGRAEIRLALLREDRERRQMERAIMMRKLDDRPLEKIARRLDKRKGDKHG